MDVILIWDLPARLFHWAFAGSLTVALAIGFLVDDDAPLFQPHMIFGISAFFLLVPALFIPGIGVFLPLGESEGGKGK
ncbi:MAG: hypothetical protein Q8Q59_00675 [Luteolibacter sp.]|jgi:cytochrome b|nr:hypothetical protein [Luteolibacter sp.]